MECSIDGCCKPVKMRGWCSMHYTRNYRHGDPMWEPMTESERFDAKVNRNGPVIYEHLGPCWEWTAGTFRDGYGQFKSDDGGVPAHRFAWIAEYGPLSRDIFVCHHCDNPKCVRLDHLWVGTCAENLADMAAKGRGNGRGAGDANLAKTHCPKNHPYLGDNLYVSPDGKRHCRECRREIDRRSRRKRKHQTVTGG